MTEPDWAHLENLRMWRVLAARGHEGAQAVVSHHSLAPLPALPPLPTQRPTPAPVNVAVPRAPRATVPQPATPVLSGLQGRVDMLTRLVNPPPLPPGLL
jgi:hypothetical protein